MSNCASCGAPGCSTRHCSMCYGDIDHGTDGYYREWAEAQEQEDHARAAYEQAQMDEMDAAAQQGDAGPEEQS